MDNLSDTMSVIGLIFSDMLEKLFAFRWLKRD